jgi:hypothetical protein
MADDDATYKIVRFYQDVNRGREVVATGLTLAEAKEHCDDPETRSRTATSDESVKRTAECGPWFDGWQAE